MMVVQNKVVIWKRPRPKRAELAASRSHPLLFGIRPRLLYLYLYITLQFSPFLNVAWTTTVQLIDLSLLISFITLTLYHLIRSGVVLRDLRVETPEREWTIQNQRN